MSAGASPGGVFRSLTKFDLSQVPSNTTLDSAQLQLYFDQTHGNADPYSQVYEARRAPRTGWRTPRPGTARPPPSARWARTGSRSTRRTRPRWPAPANGSARPPPTSRRRSTARTCTTPTRRPGRPSPGCRGSPRRAVTRSSSTTCRAATGPPTRPTRSTTAAGRSPRRSTRRPARATALGCRWAAIRSWPAPRTRWCWATSPTRSSSPTA
ncbi:hypothetical protein ACQP2F_16685 [Actinoplanes sp. CA-030573]|uniref:hypothetical protein n=1 Tax=Actinoplanes sp. CA-030573 TaxID=3239898 RepID=UPI003D8BB5EA